MDEAAVEVTPVRRWAERRRVVLGSAAALFAVVSVLVLRSHDPSQAISLLYIIPIALVALELGFAAGVATAAIGMLVLAGRAIFGELDLDAVGYLTRALAMGSVAMLAGQFSDRMRAGVARQQHLLDSGLALARLEEAESLPGAVAEQAKRLVGARAVTVALDNSEPVARGVAAGRPLMIPITSRGSEYGLLEVSPAASRAFSAEDELALAMLAQQAGVAAENRRLLLAERERIAHGGQVLAEQEAERREIGYQLHEEVAQTMAAALIALSFLKGDPGGVEESGVLADTRGHLEQALADLRGLAASLRPAVLEQLGLEAALERLCAGDEERPRGIALRFDPAAAELNGWAQTVTYRVVEGLLARLESVREVDVALEGDALRVAVKPGADAFEPAAQVALGPLRTRLELIGGALGPTLNGSARAAIVARIPVRDAAAGA